MHGDEIGYIQEAFERNWIAPLGFNCDGFEAETAHYLSADLSEPYHALALVSGTSALHLAVKLAGVKPGDVVLCSDMTFSATVNPVSYEGGVQVENESGTVLPSSGGMGTTLFYVVGGLLMAAAAVLLIAKKRMGKNA